MGEDGGALKERKRNAAATVTSSLGVAFIGASLEERQYIYQFAV